jgi:2-oxoglutarate ferredoxin oxidoreductase subunit beta
MAPIERFTPPQGAGKVGDFKPRLLQSADHHLCAGCGHPPAVRAILEAIDELSLDGNVIGLFSHGCSGTFNRTVDIDLTIALHGRAPATATGVKRMRPGTIVFTMQGDGDMVSEGLAEILHTAARGENITCILLNNGVFGDTGGQMTAASALGQRTKTSLDGRNADDHGYPIAIAPILATFPGVAYVARTSVHNPAGIARTRKCVKAALEHQIGSRGFSFVEILTMCPTGWFKSTREGPDYLKEAFIVEDGLGVLKDRNEPARRAR